MLLPSVTSKRAVRHTWSPSTTVRLAPRQLTWNFGDNTAPEIIPNSQNSISHLYANPGVYTITVRLQNDCSDTTIERTVTVYDRRQPISRLPFERSVFRGR